MRSRTPIPERIAFWIHFSGRYALNSAHRSSLRVGGRYFGMPSLRRSALGAREGWPPASAFALSQLELHRTAEGGTRRFSKAMTSSSRNRATSKSSPTCGDRK